MEVDETKNPESGIFNETQRTDGKTCKEDGFGTFSGQKARTSSPDVNKFAMLAMIRTYEHGHKICHAKTNGFILITS